MAIQHLLVLRTQPSYSCRGAGTLPRTLPAVSTPKAYFDRASRRLSRYRPCVLSPHIGTANSKPATD